MSVSCLHLPIKYESNPEIYDGFWNKSVSVDDRMKYEDYYNASRDGSASFRGILSDNQFSIIATELLLVAPEIDVK